MHILRATESGYTEMNKKNLFSLPLSITAFYDTKNFNKDGQQIETFPCNGFYFQDELVWNWVLQALEEAMIFRGLDKINHKKCELFFSHWNYRSLRNVS